MNKTISVDPDSQVPVYKQLINEIQRLTLEGKFQKGDYIPSMNELSQTLTISKETVKKSYSILRKKGIIESAHGKGFYVTDQGSIGKIKVLMLFDKLSTYKLVLSRSFTESAQNLVNTTIHIHNQDVDLFESLLEENLGNFDYYIITPHFPLINEIQGRVLNVLKKIPNRKLIILDRKMDLLKGNYGAVYQDFEHDVYRGLLQGKELLGNYNKVNTISTGGSLYSKFTEKGIAKFCREYKIKHEHYNSITQKQITRGDVYIVLNSQLDIELIEIIRIAKFKGLKIGEDIGIVSYNESPINEIILDGLTVLSTDFKEMGKLAAEMVISGKLMKVWNRFDLIVRKTL